MSSLSRTLFILSFVVFGSIATGASLSKRAQNYRAPSPGALDMIAAQFAGLDSCGDDYGPAASDLNIDDLTSLRCALGATVEGRARGTRAITDTVHQLLFQQIARNSHQASICQSSFFGSYLNQPKVAAAFNATAKTAFSDIRAQLKSAIAQKERYEELKKISVNAYNGSAADHLELIELEKNKQGFETAIVLLPKMIPLGNNPLVEDLVIKAAKANLSDVDFEREFQTMIPKLKSQADKSVATYSAPEMRANDGSYSITRDMQTEFVRSGEMQALIENTETTPRAKNIAICQMQKIYDTGNKIKNGATAVGEFAGITALTFLAPPIGVELAGASVAARSAYAARALMISSRSVQYAIRGTVLLTSLPGIQKTCFSRDFLTSSKASCEPTESFNGIMHEQSAVACAAQIALAATAFAIPVRPKALLSADKAVAEKLGGEKVLAETPFEKLKPHASDDVQIKMWQLEEAGDFSAANALKNEIKLKLKTLKIEKLEDLNATKHSSVQSAGEPYLVTFEDGSHGIWKPQGSYQNPKMEVAAYDIDQQLGLNQVPLTIERTIDGRVGTIQLYVGRTYGGTRSKPSNFELFDSLMRNGDRNSGNYLLRDGRSIAIDHGMSQRVGISKLPPQLDVSVSQGVSYAKEAIKNYKFTIKNAETTHAFEGELVKVRLQLAEIIGRKSVYDRLVGTTPTQWQNVLKETYTEPQIADFLRVRERVIKEVENARSVLGDDIFESGLTSPIIPNRAANPGAYPGFAPRPALPSR